MFLFGLLPETVLLSHATTVVDLKYQTEHDRYRLQPQPLTLLLKQPYLEKDLPLCAIIPHWREQRVCGLTPDFILSFGISNSSLDTSAFI